MEPDRKTTYKNEQAEKKVLMDKYIKLIRQLALIYNKGAFSYTFADDVHDIRGWLEVLKKKDVTSYFVDVVSSECQSMNDAVCQGYDTKAKDLQAEKQWYHDLCIANKALHYIFNLLEAIHDAPYPCNDLESIEKFVKNPTIKEN